MKTVKYISFPLIIAVFVAGNLWAENNDDFWGWSVSAGANFGFGLKAKLKTSPANAIGNIPVRANPSAPTYDALRAKLEGAKTGKNGGVSDFGNGYYIDSSSSLKEGNPNTDKTHNWRLPDSAVKAFPEGSGYPGNKAFVMDGDDYAWADVSTSERGGIVSDSEKAPSYGASVELSHMLWMSEDESWGLDFAFGLTWMKSRNCFNSTRLAYQRAQTTASGQAQTVISGEFLGNPSAECEADGTWGNNYDGDETDTFGDQRESYDISVNNITVSRGDIAYSETVDSLYINTDGDYEEWDLAFMLRPWYQLDENFCIHGTLGLGVTRSSFEYSMEAVCNGSTVYQSSGEFDEWDIYGIVGAGLLMRLGDFDVSCDGLFRFCQDDMEIRSRDVNGTIEKPWAVVRLGLGYAF